MTTEEYAIELLIEAPANTIPHRWAFCEAIEARGTDARTKQFRHYDRIIKWMMENWKEQLG